MDDFLNFILLYFFFIFFFWGGGPRIEQDPDFVKWGAYIGQLLEKIVCTLIA